jgi:hypothetical protein
MDETILASLTWSTDHHIRITAHWSGEAAKTEDFLLPFLVIGMHYMETNFTTKESQKKLIAMRTMGSMDHNEVLQSMYEKCIHPALMPLIGKAALAQIVTLTKSHVVSRKHEEWLDRWSQLRGEGATQKALNKITWGDEGGEGDGLKLIKVPRIIS